MRIMGGGMGNLCGTVAATSRVDGIERDGSSGGERYGAPYKVLIMGSTGWWWVNHWSTIGGCAS